MQTFLFLIKKTQTCDCAPRAIRSFVGLVGLVGLVGRGVTFAFVTVTVTRYIHVTTYFYIEFDLFRMLYSI